MRASKQIDYFTVTFPIPDATDKSVPFLDWRYRGKGRHGYRAMYSCDAIGATLETSAVDASMGTHLVLPGRAMTYIRQIAGLADDDFVEWVSANKGKPSRIDMCIDVRGGQETPESLLADIQNGEARVKTRALNLDQGKTDGTEFGSTLYIGSWHSDAFMRVYDKRAERAIVDLDAWVRFELVTKNLKAQAAQKAILSNGAKAAIGAHIGSFLCWSSAEYNLALDTTLCPIERIEKKKMPRQQWLLGVVAKTLAKELVFNPEFESEFMSAVNEFIADFQKSEL